MKTQLFTKYPLKKKKKKFLKDMKHYDHQPDLMVELDFTDDGLN